MKKLTLTTLLTLTLTALTAHAYGDDDCNQAKQERQQKRMQHKMEKMQNRIIDKLELNEAQQTQWRSLNKQHQQERQDLRKDSQALHKALREAQQATPQDAQKIQDLAAQIGAQKTQQVLLRNKHQQALAALLNEEQKEAWQTMQKRFKHHRSPRFWH